MDNRKLWTQQQDQLRKALASKARFNEAIQLFMRQHAAVHAAEISGDGWSLHDESLAGLTDEQIKTCPKPGANSIAWLLWHITRIEDMTINVLVLEQPQILDANWLKRLGFPLRDCGASMETSEVESFNTQISIPALKEYRAAVGRSTRSGVPDLETAQIKAAVPTERVQILVDDSSISPRANWLFEFYTNRTKGFFLTRTATSHNFIHLYEAVRVRAKLVSKGK